MLGEGSTGRMVHPCTIVEHGQSAVDHVKQHEEGLYDAVLPDGHANAVIDRIEAIKNDCKAKDTA